MPPSRRGIIGLSARHSLYSFYHTTLHCQCALTMQKKFIRDARLVQCGFAYKTKLGKSFGAFFVFDLQINFERHSSK